MSDQARRVETFRELHRRAGRPLLLANAWDAGSAKLLASLGFEALATTSSGHAATLGRLDGDVSREEALDHARDIVAATGLPVSADLENGFAHDAEGVARTVRGAVEAGLAGCSIEDHTGDGSDPIYELAAARERVAAAVEAAGGRIVLTARAENHIHGRHDLGDTIARLQAYEAAGADVLYAPGLRALADIEAVVSSVSKPVNVLTWPEAPSVTKLAAAGVARVSVGGMFAFVALDAVARAGRELLDQGTYGFIPRAGAGSAAFKAALGR